MYVSQFVANSYIVQRDCRSRHRSALPVRTERQRFSLPGVDGYERRRARAMTLLMRYAGLRISDVVTVSRERIKGNRPEKRAVKNSKWIRVELPSAVLAALDLLPPPKAAARGHLGRTSVV
jgi:hypothetical protein